MGLITPVIKDARGEWVPLHCWLSWRVYRLAWRTMKREEKGVLLTWLFTGAMVALALLGGLFLLILVPGERDTGAVMTLAAAGALRWVPRAMWWSAVAPAVRRAGHCPSCCYPIKDVAPMPRGPKICPECGAAWWAVVPAWRRY